jgi:hypothetical protein
MLRGLSYVYHPFKIGKLGIATYQEWFYQVQKPLIWTEQKSCLGASGQEWILIELQVLRTA